MQISFVSASGFANFSSKASFKGEFIPGNDMISLCGLEQSFIKNWKKRLPENSAVVFEYLNDDKIRDAKLYAYKASVGEKTAAKGLLNLSSYNVRSWDTYDMHSWETVSKNRQNLVECLTDCLNRINKILKK